jgi:hypothetical protein
MLWIFGREGIPKNHEPGSFKVKGEEGWLAPATIATQATNPISAG